MSLTTKIPALILTLQIFLNGVARGDVEAVLGSIALKDNVNLSNIIPTTSASEILLSREQYVISYNKEKSAPNWVAWKIEANQLGSVGRSNDFAKDLELEKYLTSTSRIYHAVAPEDYKDTCFDRGHQIPSADRTDSLANNEATFVMSNMIPQTAHLNRVTWEHLERYTRELVQTKGKKVYVIDGPIYDQNLGSIGAQSNIPIPSKDFKIIFILAADQKVNDIDSQTPSIAVIMPNSLEDGSLPTDKVKLCKESTANDSVAANSNADVNDWQQYKTTVQTIEGLTGLKFGI